MVSGAVFMGSNPFLGEHLQRKQEEQGEVHGQKNKGNFHFQSVCVFWFCFSRPARLRGQSLYAKTCSPDMKFFAFIFKTLIVNRLSVK